MRFVIPRYAGLAGDIFKATGFRGYGTDCLSTVLLLRLLAASRFDDLCYKNKIPGYPLRTCTMNTPEKCPSALQEERRHNYGSNVQ